MSDRLCLKPGMLCSSREKKLVIKAASIGTKNMTALIAPYMSIAVWGWQLSTSESQVW
jgi:hypothetical protein